MVPRFSAFFFQWRGPGRFLDGHFLGLNLAGTTPAQQLNVSRGLHLHPKGRTFAGNVRNVCRCIDNIWIIWASLSIFTSTSNLQQFL
jgi:hypothetical protein